MRGFNLSAWAIAHRALVLYLMLVVAAGGVYAYVKLGRAEDPNFTIKVMVVTADWPGATADEIKNQVADRIEKKLQELPFLDRVETYTRPGTAVLQIVLRDTTPPGQVRDLWYQVRKKVGDIRGDLPAGVNGPWFNDEYGDVYSALYMLSAAGQTMADLKRQAEDIRQSLLRVPGISKVDIIGAQPERIHIELSHGRLATLGITPQQVFDSVARQNAVVASGSIDTAADRINVRVSGALDGVEAIAAVPVAADGRIFRLGDIATVTAGYQDPPRFLVRQEGQPAIGIGAAMAEGTDIIALGRDLERAAAAIRQELPVGVELKQIADQPHVVEGSIAEFVRVFAEALVIVMVVSLLSLGLRTGIVVALSVPLVLAIVFLVMYAAGVPLHRITLGALIIALGLLVDDAIIAIEMMVVKMEQGWDRAAAASYAWTSTAFPMLTGTLVTAAGFLPVGFAKSSSGEYAGGIFWVVGLALIVSWLVAVVFIPYLGFKLLPDFAKRARHANPDAVYDTRIYRWLRGAVAAAVRWRRTVVVATVALFALSIWGFGQVQQQFFPTSTRPELFLEMRLPEGSAIGASLATAEAAEKLLAGDGDIATYTTYVGQGSPRFWLGLNPALPNPNFAQIVILARDTPARERIKARLDRAIADGALPQARVRVDRFVFGPPVGFPVQFRVAGPDAEQVRRIAVDVRRAMAEDRRVIDPHPNWGEQAKSVRLAVDQDRARAMGLTPQEIGATLATLLSGYTVTQQRRGIELIDVVARATPEERLSLDRLPELTVATRGGVAVPLSQVARVEYDYEEPILWRRNRDVVMTVRGDVVDGVQPPDVTRALQPRMAQIAAGLPPGYRIEAGGSAEESAKANASIAAVLPVTLLVMLTLLMIQLQSFGRLALVFSTAPLGIIGAAGMLLATGRPFGFVALLGLLALSGMIMRNAVILVDQIEHDVAAGHPRQRAIIDATVRRSRPVVLTALAAILAMIPLSSSVFWGPMATTIMGGLMVATVLTLFFLPALYALAFRTRDEAPATAAKPAAADPMSGAAAAPAE
ncbi:multidrug efflux pump subunit AcrB [Stella humosa]|uniref:Multidrug efflux pump subunit AcrB n=1 Tax=Stella humosa TaxID=94 RepID=A0A3N1KS80_9PROT|nr:efflux RND transporter permease subunit [Stella humosa]ROP83441.1 multidrug efflux pump subunit AcrB [Stella humosa]BBK33287.1 cation efflux system protein [Stella humosa]